MGAAEAYPIITNKDVRRYVLGGCHHVTEAVRVTSCERLGLPDQGAVAKEPGSPVRTRRSRAKRKRESLVQNTTSGSPERLVPLQESRDIPECTAYRSISSHQAEPTAKFQGRAAVAIGPGKGSGLVSRWIRTKE